MLFYVLVANNFIKINSLYTDVDVATNSQKYKLNQLSLLINKNNFKINHCLTNLKHRV